MANELDQVCAGCEEPFCEDCDVPHCPSCSECTVPSGQVLTDEDVRDLDLSKLEDYLEARRRAKKKLLVKQPDFATVDWKSRPVIPELADQTTCPSCPSKALTLEETRKVFGTRKKKRWDQARGAYRVELAQSLCKPCRAAHGKAQRAKKRKAAEQQSGADLFQNEQVGST